MSKGLKVYVCNVATQHGETDAFAVSDHCRVIDDHVHHQLFQYVVANSNIAKDALPEAWHAEPVRMDTQRMNGTMVLAADVVSENNRYHHDTEKLATAVMNLYYQRRQVDALIAPVLPEREPQEAAAL